jgi:glycosyltransferase involved in cell wall biosynthesis
MSISVVVPTKNEERNIPYLLASVPPDIQVVVCDASSDGTPGLVARLRPKNTLILEAPGTIAEARQRGALASSGDVLVFTDADVEFASNYFEYLGGLLAGGYWDALCGAKLSRGPFASDYAIMRRAQSAAYHVFGIAAASGSNMAITRRAFLALGGFRPRLRCNEDTELFLRAGRRGLCLRFDARLVVWARDHRRLQHGRLAKAAHSVIRNVLLYLTCRWTQLPRLLEDDWGYWKRV